MTGRTAALCPTDSHRHHPRTDDTHTDPDDTHTIGVS
jgi:hypothetical protein